MILQLVRQIVGILIRRNPPRPSWGIPEIQLGFQNKTIPNCHKDLKSPILKIPSHCKIHHYEQQDGLQRLIHHSVIEPL